MNADRPRCEKCDRLLASHRDEWRCDCGWTMPHRTVKEQLSLVREQLRAPSGYRPHDESVELDEMDPAREGHYE